MKTVRDVLRTKGNQVWSVTPDTTVYDALKLMADQNIGAVVVAEAGRLVGVLSEREYARQVVLRGRSSKAMPVREIMVSPVAFVGPQQSIEECMALMTEKRVRHLPVLENDVLVGMLSIGDAVKAVIDEKEFLIEQLATYIQRG